MQGVGQVRQGLPGNPPQDGRNPRDKEGDKGVGAVHAGPIRAVDKDLPLHEPPQHRQDVRVLHRQGQHLHPHGVHGGRVTLQTGQNGQTFQGGINQHSALRDLRGCEVPARARYLAPRYQALEHRADQRTTFPI